MCTLIYCSQCNQRTPKGPADSTQHPPSWLLVPNNGPRWMCREELSAKPAHEDTPPCAFPVPAFQCAGLPELVMVSTVSTDEQHVFVLNKKKLLRKQTLQKQLCPTYQALCGLSKNSPVFLRKPFSVVCAIKYSSEVIWDKANAGTLEGVTKVHTESTNPFSTGPNTFSACLHFPQEQWILCRRSIFCKHAAFGGGIGARSSRCVHASVPVHCSPHLTALAGALACLAGHWRWLTALFLVSRNLSQQLIPPVSPVILQKQELVLPAHRESSLFTEDICRCTCPRCINGHLWDYRGN